MCMSVLMELISLCAEVLGILDVVLRFEFRKEDILIEYCKITISDINEQMSEETGKYYWDIAINKMTMKLMN